MTTPAHKSEGVNRTKTVRFYSFFGNDEDLQWRADKLFKQSLEQVNYRVLHENDLECIMRNKYAKEEFGYRIDGTPYQTKADISFDHSQLNEMLDDLNHGEEKEVYFYHSDHLGSASWITDSAGIAVQHLQYLPYGEPYIDQRAAGTTYSERFRFTGKERDEETGYGYFGARYMDYELTTMWLSVDPMADKYPSISPYAYCAWNPVKLVDPDGREIDDYFSYTGKYLGSDDAKTDNVRIIEESLWDKLSVNGTIEHTLGKNNSKSFSSAHCEMSEAEQLEVYQHYNPTKCELYSTSSRTHPGNSGMVTKTEKKKTRIGIYLKDNFRGIKVADHAFEIINMFVHEKRHVVNAGKSPRMADFEDEASAFDAQVHHDSWIHCRPEYKHAVTDYAREVTFWGLYIDLFDPYADIWNH